MGKQHQTLVFWAPKSLQMVTAATKLKDTYSLEGKLWPTYIAYWKARHYFANKGPSSQGRDFSSSHVWIWELDCEESWAPKNWCFWTVVLEKTLEIPLDCKEIQPVHSKRNQSWVFIRRTDAEAETPILWPPREKSWLIGKDPDDGRDWRQEENTLFTWILIVIEFLRHSRNLINATYILVSGLLRWLRGKKSTCQCRRQRFDPWVRKTP